MKYIELTQRYFAKVDDEDYEKVKHLKWNAQKQRTGKFYARHCYKDENKKVQAIYMHRFIMNCPKGKFIDHINGDTLDNRKENLRIVTSQQNNMNRSPLKGKASKYKGVRYRKDRGHYSVTIYHNYKCIYVGSSKNEEEAAKMYNEKAKELFGEYAKLNNVEE